MTVSYKVSAATIGATVSTLVVGILNVHVFPHGMAPDVQSLITAGVVALTTFGAGVVTRDLPVIEKEIASAEASPVARAADVVYTQIKQADPVAVADVAKALETTVARDTAEVEKVVLPVARAV